VARAESDLSFVTEPKLRELVEDYGRQAIAAYEAGAYLGTLVACGAVVEGLPAWAVLTFRAAKASTMYPHSRVEQREISRLIKFSSKEQLIGQTAETASWAVKEFRNFIHPYNLLRSGKSARADEALAMSALAAVREITRSLSGRLPGGSAPEAHNVTAHDVEGSVLHERSAHEKVLNFSWLVQRKIAGCRGPRSNKDLTLLVELGIRALVRLAEIGEASVTRTQVAAAGLEDCHEPVPDCTAPRQDQIDRVVAFLDGAVRDGKPVAVSCGAGYGRTSTLLACYLVKQGASANDAISAVRAKARRGPETDEQETVIREFEGRLKRESSETP
jgi:atypical dual specificity phosphatase